MFSLRQACSVEKVSTVEFKAKLKLETFFICLLYLCKHPSPTYFSFNIQPGYLRIGTPDNHPDSALDILFRKKTPQTRIKRKVAVITHNKDCRIRHHDLFIVIPFTAAARASGDYLGIVVLPPGGREISTPSINSFF